MCLIEELAEGDVTMGPMHISKLREIIDVYVREVMVMGPAPIEGLMPASVGQEHMLVLQELSPNSGAYNSPLLLRLSGSLDRLALTKALERIIQRHDVLRSQLLRDFVDSEPAVVQLTTPMAEFNCDLELWTRAEGRPHKQRLRPQTFRKDTGGA